MCAAAAAAAAAAPAAAAAAPAAAAAATKATDPSLSSAPPAASPGGSNRSGGNASWPSHIMLGWPEGHINQVGYSFPAWPAAEAAGEGAGREAEADNDGKLIGTVRLDTRWSSG